MICHHASCLKSVDGYFMLFHVVSLSVSQMSASQERLSQWHLHVNPCRGPHKFDDRSRTRSKWLRPKLSEILNADVSLRYHSLVSKSCWWEIRLFNGCHQYQFVVELGGRCLEVFFSGQATSRSENSDLQGAVGTWLRTRPASSFISGKNHQTEAKEMNSSHWNLISQYFSSFDFVGLFWLTSWPCPQLMSWKEGYWEIAEGGGRSYFHIC